jgi:DNA-binding NtrC family response regulator
MVLAFATQSGGGLRIDSVPGRGTEVELLLPRAAVTLAAGTQPALPRDATARGTVVLLIEDDEQVRAIAAAHLTALGCTVVEAANAEAAYAMSHTLGRLDLVVSDVVMPGAHGPVIVERLRADRPGLPVIYITGFRDREELDGETVLEKPFSLNALSHAVRDKLGR